MDLSKAPFTPSQPARGIDTKNQNCNWFSGIFGAQNLRSQYNIFIQQYMCHEILPFGVGFIIC